MSNMVWVPVGDEFIYLHPTGLQERPELFVRWQGESDELGVGETNNDALYCPLPDNVRLCQLVPAPAAVTLPVGEIEACLDRLVSVFGDDANNMPDDLLDDYLAVRLWIEEQQKGGDDAS